MTCATSPPDGKWWRCVSRATSARAPRARSSAEHGVRGRHVDDERVAGDLLADGRARGLRIDARARAAARGGRSSTPSPWTVGGRRRADVERAEVRQIGDPDAGEMLVLARHRRRDEPAVALLERRVRSAEEPLGGGARHRVEAALVPRRATARGSRGRRSCLEPLARRVEERPEMHAHRTGSAVDLDDEPAPSTASSLRDDREPDHLAELGASAARTSRDRRRRRRRRPARPRPASRRSGSRTRRASTGARGRRPAASPTCRPTRTPCRSSRSTASPPRGGSTRSRCPGRR